MERASLNTTGIAAARAWFAGSRGALVLVWALFVLPRAALIALQVEPTSDAAWYYSRADFLARGLGYLGDHGAPTAYWPPGWPLALAAVFKAFGTSVTAVGLFNLGCAAVSGWLAMDLGRRIFDSRLAARIALLLLAIYPNAIGYVPLALTEVFYTMLLLAGCRLLIAAQGRGGAAHAALLAAGVVFGLATLVKAQTLVVVPLVLAIGLLRAEGFWRRLPGALARFAVVIALAALTVAPWSLRNQRELGQFVMVSTNGGITLLTGNNDSARGGFTPEDPVVQALDARADLDELAYDAEAKRLGIAWIAHNPSRFLTLVPMKLLRLWGPDGEAQWAYETGYRDYAAHAGLFRAVRIANQLYYMALLAAFALAAVVIVRRRWLAGDRLLCWWLLPYGIAAYPSAIAMVFSGQSRFHYPVMPFVCMAAAWLLAEWLSPHEGESRAA